MGSVLISLSKSLLFLRQEKASLGLPLPNFSTVVLRQKTTSDRLQNNRTTGTQESPGNAPEADWFGPVGKGENHCQKRTGRKEGEVVLQVWQKHSSTGS